MEAPGEERTGRAPPLGQPGCCSALSPHSKLRAIAGPGVHCPPGQILEMPGQLTLSREHLTCHGHITLNRLSPSRLAVPSRLLSFVLCPCQPGLNYTFSPPGHGGPFSVCSSLRYNLSPSPSPNTSLPRGLYSPPQCERESV